MVKSLIKNLTNERFSDKKLTSTQRSIPIRSIHNGGIWRVGNNFSKCWRFSDINYSVASQNDQMEMFLAYCNVLNALSTDATTKITINNHHINSDEFRRKLLIAKKDDGLNDFRGEYNRMLLEKAENGNGIVQEKYITVSVNKKNLDEAVTFFTRLGNDLQANMGKLSSRLHEMSNKERLRIFHDFFRSGEENNFVFNEQANLRKGQDCRDSIAPDSLQFKGNHFVMGDKVGRVLFLKDYANYVKDSMISELTDFSRNLMLSIDILPIPTDEAVKEIENCILRVESRITNWQRKQNEQNNFSAQLQFGDEQARAETREFMNDLTSRDQRMMFTLTTLVHLADSLEKLDADTESLESIARKHLCQLATMNFQQEDALNTVLPYGLRKIEAVRTMTTESTAVLMPFSSQEIQDDGGIFYGINAVSRNLIVCNRKHLMNGNGFVLGVSGSGKSFSAKQEIASIALSTDDDILIVDPEREYTPLIKALGGEIVRISADSPHHINALDMPKEVIEGEKPVTLKSEFVLSLCDVLYGDNRSLTTSEKSIIDRCVAKVYEGYMSGKFDKPPLLTHFRNEILKQPESEAKDIALTLELFTNGSLNVFAKPTNVNMDNRIMLFDILDLGKNLKTVGMLVMLDAILNRVIQNRKKNRRTWIYLDEIYLMFATPYSANFLSESWKRFRKYGGNATGITQNIEDCLRSDLARTMLANSEFLLMLNQAPTDRAELAKLLKISETQMGYITNAESGRGLIKVGANLVSFVNDFPKETNLYRLMTTKFEDNQF